MKGLFNEQEIQEAQEEAAAKQRADLSTSMYRLRAQQYVNRMAMAPDSSCADR